MKVCKLYLEVCKPYLRSSSGDHPQRPQATVNLRKGVAGAVSLAVQRRGWRPHWCRLSCLPTPGDLPSPAAGCRSGAAAATQAAQASALTLTCKQK